jgi:hypothetical protein
VSRKPRSLGVKGRRASRATSRVRSMGGRPAMRKEVSSPRSISSATAYRDRKAMPRPSRAARLMPPSTLAPRFGRERRGRQRARSETRRVLDPGSRTSKVCSAISRGRTCPSRTRSRPGRAAPMISSPMKGSSTSPRTSGCSRQLRRRESTQLHPADRRARGQLTDHDPERIADVELLVPIAGHDERRHRLDTAGPETQRRPAWPRRPSGRPPAGARLEPAGGAPWRAGPPPDRSGLVSVIRLLF